MQKALHTILCVLVVVGCLTSSVWAATFNVSTYTDVADPTPEGTCDSCSLREAIQEANLLAGPDVINLPPGTYSMDIAGADEDLGLTGDLDITDDVTIIGIGTTRIESHVGRILHVHSGNVSITGLTLLQGDANNDQNSGSAGGAVHNAAGSTLTLNLCTMTINKAQGGGGAIFNAGTLSLNGSTLSANSAAGSSRGGAVFNSGTMTVTNCTLNANSSTDGGGAIYNGPGSVLILNNTTITDNASTGGVGGGGIKADASSTVNISNTVIANNNASGANDDCEALLTSFGSNLVEDADGCAGLGPNDITLVDPLLGALQNNGGRTFTRAPQPGSQVLDTGGSVGSCEMVDQRGLARPQGTACDQGAYETFPSCPSVLLAPATLPDGQSSAFYTQTIVPGGGVPPYRFAVTAGSLPTGLALDTLTGVLSGVATGSGGNNFTITAFDANICAGSFAYSLSILSGPSCSPATITLAPTQLPLAKPGEAYSQSLVATGGTAPHLYTVTDGSIPPGLALDPNTGALSGTPTVSGTFVFVVTATDADNCTGIQGYSLQVACFFNFSPTRLPVAVEGVLYTQNLEITTGGTEPIAFAVVNGSLPPGMSLTGPGILSGTPTTPGTYPFVVQATDENFCTGVLGYIVVVDPCIKVTPVVLPGGVVGTAFLATVTATGGSGTISFSVSAGALPTGLSLDPVAGTISGTPSAPGVFLFTIAATDGSCTVEQDYFLVVDPAACPATSILPATLPGDTVGNNYNQNLTGSGGASPYSFQLVAGTLPPGINLSAGGQLSGTSLSAGSFTFTIAATDSNGCVGTLSFTLVIIPTICPALDLFPPILPNGSRGVAYDQTILATAGIAPFSYAVTGGALPAGLLLAATTGILSGTPTLLGDFSFTITATDAAGCPESLAYMMTILPDFRGTNCALFGDSFEDSVLSTQWTYVRPLWSEIDGNLVGKAGKKAVVVASPAFAGCQNCEIETLMRTLKAGDSKITLLGWYANKSNTMELTAAAGSDLWRLSQRSGGSIVATARATKRIDANVFYTVRIVFDGTMFDVYVDDLVMPLMSLTPKGTVQSGTVGFMAKATTASFGYVCVN